MTNSKRIAVPGQTCFPPLIHPFKTAAPAVTGVAAVRASVRGRVAYHDCAEKHTALIAKEKAHRKAQGLGEDVRDLEEKVTMASVSTMCAYP